MPISSAIRDNILESIVSSMEYICVVDDPTTTINAGSNIYNSPLRLISATNGIAITWSASSSGNEIHVTNSANSANAINFSLLQNSTPNRLVIYEVTSSTVHTVKAIIDGLTYPTYTNEGPLYIRDISINLTEV